MKKRVTKRVSSALVMTSIAAAVIAPYADARVSASVSASNMYYWRGIDLGGGAALSADINYTKSGVFLGIWTSSGDQLMGTEYDIYAGYGAEIGEFNYRLSYVSYNYAEQNVSWGDLSEVVLSAGYGPLTLTYYENVAANEKRGISYDDYNYLTLAYRYDQLTLTYGRHEDDMSHLDLSYAYSENLYFTVGKVIDAVKGTYNNEVKFIVALSLPLR